MKGSLLNFYNSGNSHRTGVGIITDQNFRGTFTPISDRLCYFEYEQNGTKNVFINAYAPTFPVSEENPSIRKFLWWIR